MVPSSFARHLPAVAFSTSFGMILQFTAIAPLSCAWYTSPRIRRRVTLGPTSTSRESVSTVCVTKSLARNSALRASTVAREIPSALVVVVDCRGRKSPALGRLGVLAAARELLRRLRLESLAALQRLGEDHRCFGIGALAVGGRQFLFHFLQRRRIEPGAADVAGVIRIYRLPVSRSHARVHVALHGVRAGPGG